MASQVQWRRGTTAEHAVFTGADGEVTVDTSKYTLVVHDGSTTGGFPTLLEDQTNLPSSINNGIFSPGANQISIATSGVERLAVNASGDVTIPGNLIVEGNTTTIDSITLVVEDKNIEIGSSSLPSDSGADGGGITLKATNDKTILWYDATDAWTFSEHVAIASGKSFYIDNNVVINSSGIGSGIVNSNLTSVGTIGSGVWQGSVIDKAYIDSNVVSTSSSGVVTSTMIASDTIVNANVKSDAAIAGTKIAPDFGSQDIVSSGTITGASFEPVSSGIPTNGLYLPAFNEIAISTADTKRLTIEADGDVDIDGGGFFYNATNERIGIGTSNPTVKLHVYGENIRVDRPDGDPYIDFATSGTPNNVLIYGGAADGFRIITNSSEQFRITPSGNVGIGDSSPDEKFVVRAASSGTGSAIIKKSVGSAVSTTMEVTRDAADNDSIIAFEATTSDGNCFNVNYGGGAFFKSDVEVSGSFTAASIDCGTY